MEFGRIAVAAAILAIVTAGAFAAFQVADSSQRAAPDESASVTNETIQQEFDAYQYVGKATDQYTTGFNSSVTVYNSTDTKLTEGTDYDWNESDGTVLFYNTSSTNESRTADISYNYTTNTQEVKDVSGPLTTVARGYAPLALLGGGLALVVTLLAVGVFIAKKIGGSGLAKTNR